MNNSAAPISMGRRRVLGIEDKEEWMSWLDQALAYDFPHSWSYHSLQQQSGLPLLFLYRENHQFVGIPFIKRKVDNFDWYDLTSVHGYCGPFSNVAFSELGLGYTQRFKNAFHDFLQEEKIVTVFSGLNPFMDQLALMNVFGGVKDNGKTVVIDLRVDLEAQQQQYRRNISGNIKGLRAKGWFMTEGKTDADIAIFLEIYGAAMDRLHAAARYRYDADYIAALLEAPDFDARLLFLNNEHGYPVCATIVIASGMLLQAYLLSTREEYRHASPAKLLTEEITILGRELGLAYFNLGGGLGFMEDSLYEWKRGFSPFALEYKTWRYVVNESLYELMISAHGVDPQSSADFFPLYRL
jgi:hypothetical protein